MTGFGDSLYPWDRRPGETAKSYAAFCIYRDMGAARSLRKLLASAKEEDLPFGPDRGRIWEWSSKFDWSDRAMAWDDYLDREQRLTQLEGLRQMRRAHTAVATMVVAKAAERLRNVDPMTLNIRDAALLLDLGIKIERAARGEADRLEVTMDTMDTRRHLTGRNILDLLKKNPALAEIVEGLDAAALDV